MSEGVFRGPFWLPPRQSWIPSKAAGGNVTVTPTTATLTLATFAPVIKHQITVPVKALSLTTFAPIIKLSVVVPVKALTLTTFAPTVTATANQVVTPTTKALALSTFAPVLKLVVIPGTRALTLTTFAPTVTANSGLTVTPGTKALTLTAFAPTVTTTSNQLITPATAVLTLTGLAPTVTASGGPPPIVGGAGGTFERTKPKPKTPKKPVRLDVRVTPETARLVITAYAPSIGVSDNKSVTPRTGALSVFARRPEIFVKITREARAEARKARIAPEPMPDRLDLFRGQRRSAAAVVEPKLSIEELDAQDLADLEEIASL
jgi:hypothetical protein